MTRGLCSRTSTYTSAVLEARRVPVDRRGETLDEVEARVVIERLACVCDACERVLHVAGACQLLAKPSRESVAPKVGGARSNSQEQLAECRSPPGADVDDGGQTLDTE